MLTLKDIYSKFGQENLEGSPWSDQLPTSVIAKFCTLDGLAPTFRMMDILGPDASFHRHRANTEPTTQGHQRGSVSWVSLYCPPPDHTG